MMSDRSNRARTQSVPQSNNVANNQTIDLTDDDAVIDVSDQAAYQRSIKQLANEASIKQLSNEANVQSMHQSINQSIRQSLKRARPEDDPTKLSYPLPPTNRLPNSSHKRAVDHLSRLPTDLIHLIMSWQDGAEAYLSMQTINRSIHQSVQKRLSYSSPSYNFSAYESVSRSINQSISTRSFDRCMQSARYETIRSINLSNCRSIDQSTIQQHLARCINLSNLTISCSPLIMATIARSCNKLVHLSIRTTKSSYNQPNLQTSNPTINMSAPAAGHLINPANNQTSNPSNHNERQSINQSASENHIMLAAIFALHNLALLDVSDCRINDVDCMNVDPSMNFVDELIASRIEQSSDQAIQSINQSMDQTTTQTANRARPTHIVLSSNNLSNSGLFHLRSLFTSNLIMFHASTCLLSGGFIAHLSQCDKLMYVNISNNPSINQSKPQLINQSQITSDVSTILHVCHDLTYLNISRTRFHVIGLKGTEHRSLRELIMNDCLIDVSIDCSMLDVISTRFPDLMRLEVAAADLNDDMLIEWMTQLSKGFCFSLRYLNLARCVAITTKGCQTIVKTFSNLQTLNIADCHFVSSDRLIEYSNRQSRAPLPSVMDLMTGRVPKRQGLQRVLRVIQTESPQRESQSDIVRFEPPKI